MFLKQNNNFTSAHYFRLFLSGFISNFLTSWLIVGSFTMFLNVGNKVMTPEFLHSSSLFAILIAIAVCVIIMTLINFRLKKAICGAYALPYAIIIIAHFINSFSMAIFDEKLFLSFVIFLAISVYYSYRCGCYANINFSSKKTIIGIVISSAVITVILILISSLRYYSYSAPNYDFGIFVNMYHNMKESFSPVTTCERDKLLSHFAVHVSPIYYLLLPVYYIIPSPYTLQIAQALLIYSGIIPLNLLMKHFGLNNNVKLLTSLIFLCYPVFACGCFYDFHENCFLVPLLMWMFYFFEKEKLIPTVVFAVLTCAVKEDATVYVAIFAVYAVLSRRKIKRGILLFAIAMFIFAFDCIYLSMAGEGIMSGRFSGLIYGNDGLFGVVRTVIANPSYFLSTLLNTNDDDNGKLIYLMNLLLPLACLPFFSKKISRYILIAPIFINLMSSYFYQYNIGFQYHFGIAAFLFYASLLNISDIDKSPSSQRKLHTFLLFAVLVSVLLYSIKVMPTFTAQLNRITANSAEYEQMNDILDTIPDDAEVTCSTFLLPHIADRDVIYEVHYHDVDSVLTEYLILDMRPSYAEGSLEFANKYIALGYELTEEYPDLISIYRLNTAKEVVQ